MHFSKKKSYLFFDNQSSNNHHFISSTTLLHLLSPVSNTHTPQVILHLCDLDFISMENSRRECSRHVRFEEDLGEMFGSSRATRCNERQAQRGLRGDDEGDVVAAALPIHVDAVQHDFACAEVLTCLGEIMHLDFLNG